VRRARPSELGRVHPLRGARIERQVEPFLHDEQAEAAHRTRAHLQRRGDLLVRPAGATRRNVGLAQDARVRDLARRRFPAAGHLL